MLTTEHHLAVCRQHSARCMEIAERTMEHAGLTRMQRVVARGLLKGMNTKEIADDIGIHYQSASKHLEAIYQRLGVNDRSRAILALLGMLP